MDFLYSEIAGVPVFYIVPILFFGPMVIFVLYQMGVKNLVKIPGEMIAKHRRQQEELRSAKAKRGGYMHTGDDAYLHGIAEVHRYLRDWMTAPDGVA